MLILLQECTNTQKRVSPMHHTYERATNGEVDIPHA